MTWISCAGCVYDFLAIGLSAERAAGLVIAGAYLIGASPAYLVAWAFGRITVVAFGAWHFTATVSAWISEKCGGVGFGAVGFGAVYIVYHTDVTMLTVVYSR